MGFSKKTGTTSKIEQQNTIHAGINHSFNDRTYLRYHYARSNQQASRLVEPTSIKSQYTKHQWALGRTWQTTKNWQVHAAAGYRSHRAQPLSFTRYRSGKFTLISIDGSPIVALKANDSAFTVAINATHKLSPKLQWSIGIEERRVTVQTLFNSSLLNDAVAGPALRREAPQRQPWNEWHTVLNTSSSWKLHPRLTLAADLRYYQISRSKYVPKAGKKDLNSNIQLDAYLFIPITQSLTAYLHGTAYQNYLLGDVPMAYNTRTNHRFSNPYGLVSIGVSWKK